MSLFYWLIWGVSTRPKNFLIFGKKSYYLRFASNKIKEPKKAVRIKTVEIMSVTLSDGNLDFFSVRIRIPEP